MFTPFRLRSLELQNRVVVSPMCQYSAQDGTVNDWHLVHLGSRALGGAGLVIAEMTDVSPEGRITLGCSGLWRDEHTAAWKRVVEFVHDNSQAKIAIQLAHAGRKASAALGGGPLKEGAWQTVGPSAIAWSPTWPAPKEMDAKDIAKVIADFGAATKRALTAGFDLIELHMAHGYLLSSFLSPLSNQRKDAYGGSLAGRLKLPLEVLDAVRAVWPADKPISCRISAVDWKEGGQTIEDSVEVAKALKAHGCDIVDVSSGGTVPDAKITFGRLYQTPFSERIRMDAKVPTMTVGAIFSHGDANGILAAGRADLCLLARGHLYDPYFTVHAAAEQGWGVPWPEQYAAVQRFKGGRPGGKR